MKGLSRGLVITLILTLAAAIGGTWIGARYIYDQGHQPSLHEFVVARAKRSCAPPMPNWLAPFKPGTNIPQK